MDMPAFIPTDLPPMVLFNQWYNDALASEPNDANAMTLATLDEKGMPDARIVLLKSHNDDGFGFFTNTTSTKGQQLAAHKNVALVFHWKSLLRQIRITGTAERVSDSVADDYFAKRYRTSQIGAWASQQSQPLDAFQTFEKRIQDFDEKFKDQPVPRPPHWGGYVVRPEKIEFWQQRDFRLHERIIFTRTETQWAMHRVFP